MKILKGEGYTQARLAGIMHECYVMKTGRIPTGITKYGNGYIIEIVNQEEVDGETVDVITYGLVIDETSEYYDCLPAIHKDRLEDYEVPVAEEV